MPECILDVHRRNAIHSFGDLDPTDIFLGPALRVAASAGDAVLFYNKFGNGTNDPASKHGGCPPMNQSKFAINGWMWNGPQIVEDENFDDRSRIWNEF